MKEMHVIMKGRVQGVGFRATTRYYARALGLNGTVRNLSDGSVEIYAQGPMEDLEKLIQKLKEEFNLPHIQEDFIHYHPIHHSHVGFHIIP